MRAERRVDVADVRADRVVDRYSSAAISRALRSLCRSALSMGPPSLAPGPLPPAVPIPCARRRARVPSVSARSSLSACRLRTARLRNSTPRAADDAQHLCPLGVVDVRRLDDKPERTDLT